MTNLLLRSHRMWSLVGQFVVAGNIDRYTFVVAEEGTQISDTKANRNIVPPNIKINSSTGGSKQTLSS